MLHKTRVWYVTHSESAQWLASQLTQSTWCGCNGFRLGEYLFVNDATCADGAQEYAVLRLEGDDYVQIESLTFSWMSEDRALDLIQRVLAGEFDKQVLASSPAFPTTVDRRRLQTREEHGRCHLCA